MMLSLDDELGMLRALSASGYSQDQIDAFTNGCGYLEKLDKFAIAALTGITGAPESGCNSTGDLAHYSYRIARSMINERQKCLNEILKKPT